MYMIAFIALRVHVTSFESWSQPTMFDRLITIAEHECWELLASAPIGRLAVTNEGRAPLVTPVNFVIDKISIVFRTGLGAKCAAALSGPVSFQADSFDGMYHTGWSVLVKGNANELTDCEASKLAVEPWAGGDRSTWLRIVPSEVTGRRVVI